MRRIVIAAVLIALAVVVAGQLLQVERAEAQLQTPPPINLKKPGR